jgi:hypothetical protein
MAYDHRNYDYSHGLLPKTHFKEKWYNTPNSGAMKPIEHPKDRTGAIGRGLTRKEGSIRMAMVKRQGGLMAENRTPLQP